MHSIIPSSANYVFDPNKNFCAVHFAQTSDGIACARIINKTMLNGVKIEASTLKPRSTHPIWKQYLELLKLAESTA